MLPPYSNRVALCKNSGFKSHAMVIYTLPFKQILKTEQKVSPLKSCSSKRISFDWVLMGWQANVKDAYYSAFAFSSRKWKVPTGQALSRDVFIHAFTPGQVFYFLFIMAWGFPWTLLLC